MRLLITRHGQTVWNLEHRYQGQGDSELTLEGAHQAQSLAGRLRGEAIDAIYSSDLRRAWRTADILRAERPLTIIRDPLWREKGYGAWEGLTREEIRQRFPDQWARRRADPANFAPPNGESLRDVQRRVITALDSLCRKHPDESVLVVTHAGTLWVLGCTLFGEDLSASKRPHLGNCSLSCLRLDGNGSAPTTECWDDMSHLSASQGVLVE